MTLYWPPFPEKDSGWAKGSDEDWDRATAAVKAAAVARRDHDPDGGTTWGCRDPVEVS